ncbi:MAG: alpha-galactosidase [Clostridia bacterium]|nr:alpha-galactosidase [Clostridia bacterium]
MAEILQQGNLYHLRNDHISYIMAVMPENVLAHIYFGGRLHQINADAVLRHTGAGDTKSFTVQECGLDRLPQEYPAFGLGDQREGALGIENADGSVAVDLRYVRAEIKNGKPPLAGLPATFGDDCKTLRVLLADPCTRVQAELLYTVFDDCDVIARSARIVNGGTRDIQLEKVMSLSLDLPDDRWEMITLNGSWARERSVNRRALMPGFQGAATQCGASSHQQSPFMALARRGTTEQQGEALGVSLIYSGNFVAKAAVYQNRSVRIAAGINDADFSWKLCPGEAFQTPEAVLVYSQSGLNGMSQEFHALWERHLLPHKWVYAHRPVLFNSWEAAYFDFDEDKLVDIARSAAEAGVELFVMDDGWFGHRDDDTTSLGDWFVNRKKLPGGLERLADRVRALGLQFGIWMEPEMVSPDSELYRSHPEWAIHIPGRAPITSRHQLILDMSREDVQDYVYRVVSDTLKACKASYIKWDMNRNFSNIGSAWLGAERQKELPHRYILGLYAVMGRLTAEFPDILFEGCAGGGGRFDPGMLYYVPQFWCSDNTDALCRCQIQYGTSLFLPPSAMRSHQIAVPNHQTGRVTPIESRFAVALGGCFGYELDPRKLTDDERGAMKNQVKYARESEDTRLHGTFYRLLSPFEGNDTAWMAVSGDQSEAVFTFVRGHALANEVPALVCLQGLDPEKVYTVRETGESYGGDELMRSGLLCPVDGGDAASLLYTLHVSGA